MFNPAELLGRGAPLDPFARRKKALERQDKVPGDAVLSPVHPPGVARDVSPDRAVFLGRGVGRIEPALGLRGRLDTGHRGPGLDLGHARLRIDADSVPAVKVDDPAPARGRGRPGQARSTPPDGDRHPPPIRQGQNRGDIGALPGKHDRRRCERDLAAVEGRRPPRGPVGPDDPGAEQPPQLLRGGGKIHRLQSVRYTRFGAGARSSAPDAPILRPRGEEVMPFFSPAGAAYSARAPPHVRRHSIRPRRFRRETA